MSIGDQDFKALSLPYYHVVYDYISILCKAKKTVWPIYHFCSLSLFLNLFKRDEVKNEVRVNLRYLPFEIIWVKKGGIVCLRTASSSACYAYLKVPSKDYPRLILT